MEFRKSKCQLNVSWGNMHHQLWLQHMLSDRAESGSSTVGPPCLNFSKNLPVANQYVLHVISMICTCNVSVREE